jgi:hypothetical protein
MCASFKNRTVNLANSTRNAVCFSYSISTGNIILLHLSSLPSHYHNLTAELELYFCRSEHYPRLTHSNDDQKPMIPGIKVLVSVVKVIQEINKLAITFPISCFPNNICVLNVDKMEKQCLRKYELNTRWMLQNFVC